MSNVPDEKARAERLAKIGETAERLAARETGGFDILPKGAAFGTKGKILSVARTSDLPLGEGESPPYPAELLLQRADGAERTLSGRWTRGLIATALRRTPTA